MCVRCLVQRGGHEVALDLRGVEVAAHVAAGVDHLGAVLRAAHQANVGAPVAKDDERTKNK